MKLTLNIKGLKPTKCLPNGRMKVNRIPCFPDENEVCSRKAFLFSACN